MNVQMLIQGHQELPATRTFTVTQPKQLLIVSGSVYWQIRDPRRDQREPNALGIQILVDGSAVGGGEAMIGKIEPGRYGSVVPAFAPLELPLGQHTLGLKNWHTLPEGSNVSYGGNHYAPIRGSASPRGRVRFA
jgi:hypothetical protein